MNLLSRLNGWEADAVEVVAKLAPWFAPLPTAWLVYDRTMRHLHWPWWVALAAAITLELLGVAILATALRLYQYNRTRRKSDPAAPVWIALVLVALYILTAEMLTVVLDIVPLIAQLAPALFPVLSVAAFGLLALRNDHHQRVEKIADDKAEARADRQRKLAERKAQQAEREAQRMEAENANMKPPRGMTKMEQVIWLHGQQPTLTNSELAATVQCSASTVTRALRLTNPS